jgi:hypothetical protein
MNSPTPAKPPAPAAPTAAAKPSYPLNKALGSLGQAAQTVLQPPASNQNPSLPTTPTKKPALSPTQQQKPPVPKQPSSLKNQKQRLSQPYATGIPVSPMGYGMYTDPAAIAQTALLTQQYQDARQLGIERIAPLILSILAILGGIIAILYYLIALFVIYIKQSSISSPLNKETVDYETIKSLSWSGKFNYILFIIFPVVTLLGVVGFVALHVFLNRTDKKPVPPSLVKFIIIVTIISILSLTIFLTVFFTIGKDIRQVKSRVDYFNRYVCSRIYKNSAFLKLMSDPKSNIVGIEQTIQEALKLITPDQCNEDIAKAFYTVTMFNHFQKIGLRNTAIFEAFDLFNPISLLVGGCNPADYMNRYGTFIEEINDLIIRPNMKQITDVTRLDEILATTSDWIGRTNGYANTLYPEDAFNSFMGITVTTVLIQCIPFVLFFVAYASPSKYPVAAAMQGLLDGLIGKNRSLFGQQPMLR